MTQHNTAAPRLERNNTEDYTTCTECHSATCYSSEVCPFCQVAQQVSDGEFQHWDFKHVINWAHRLGSGDLVQEVVILNTEKRRVPGDEDAYEIFIHFLDGSKKEQYAYYYTTLTHVNAKALCERVENLELLNGLYWKLT